MQLPLVTLLSSIFLGKLWYLREIVVTFCTLLFKISLHVIEQSKVFFIMTYLNLIVFFTQLSINESPTFCLLMLAGAKEEEK